MTSPLVSICIPVYNGQQYLSECLNSVINQSFTNYEIIITDDCSQDDSVKIIEEYSKLNSAIKLYVNHTNLGLVGNWNRCMELAQGQWIKFVFQDDTLHADCLKKMLEESGKDKPFVVCNRNFIIEEDTDPALKKYFIEDFLSIEKLYSKSKPHFLSPSQVSRNAVQNLGVNFIGEPTCVLFDRKLINQIGNFDASLSQICDLEYWLRIGTVYGINYIPEKLVNFRVHGKSATTENISTKSVKSLFLDPVVFMNKLLFHPAYQPFRNSINGIQKMKLREYFKFIIYESTLFIQKFKLDNKSIEAIATLKTIPGFVKHEIPGWKTKFIHSLILLRRKMK